MIKKSKRDDMAKMSLQFARILPVSEAVSCIKAAFSVSETTARSSPSMAARTSF
jgi:hypothetical protein